MFIFKRKLKTVSRPTLDAAYDAAAATMYARSMQQTCKQQYVIVHGYYDMSYEQREHLNRLACDLGIELRPR